MQNMKARFQYFAEVQPDFAKQSKNTSIELYKIILNTYLSQVVKNHDIKFLRIPFV